MHMYQIFTPMTGEPVMQFREVVEELSAQNAERSYRAETGFRGDIGVIGPSSRNAQVRILVVYRGPRGDRTAWQL